jgi:hypothetical protein
VSRPESLGNVKASDTDEVRLQQGQITQRAILQCCGQAFKAHAGTFVEAPQRSSSECSASKRAGLPHPSGTLSRNSLRLPKFSDPRGISSYENRQP